LQSELVSKSRWQLPSVPDDDDELTVGEDRLQLELQNGDAESRQLIDTLKCQLRQAALAQQTSDMQLDAVRQVTV